MQWKLYTDEEFFKANCKTLLKIKCTGCNKIVERTKSSIKDSIKYTNGNLYCSRLCYNKNLPEHLKALNLKCTLCNKNIKVKRSAYKRSKTKKFYCSKSCAATYNNKNKTFGNRRSKLEIWLENQLLKQYSNFKFQFNKKDAIGSELDIFIPELKLAFELNGIYHYEPIHGKALLEKIQNNDINKFETCFKNNIELCVIDTTSMKHFKEEKAEKFLHIITNIIDQQNGTSRI
jgi:hypothetical protein